MNPTIYNSALVVHVIGITIMAGTTFIDFITARQFWKAYSADKPRGLVVEDMLYRLQRWMGIGMLLIILSGVVMMVYLHQVWGQQTWFRIKMGILLLVILNGLGIRRALGARLKRLVTAEPAGNDLDKKLLALKKSIGLVHVFQLLFFVSIYVLSVFKFN